MTVSRVLRNLPGIKSSTKERVLAVVQELNYVPNPLVSALMTQLKTRNRVDQGDTLALVHCLPDGYVLTENMHSFLLAVKERAAALGYGLIEFYLRDYNMTVNRLMGILETRGIRGVIFEHFFTHGHRFDYDFSRFACVAIGPSIESPEFHRIASDQFREMQMALQEVELRRYIRIGYATLKEVEILLNYQRMAALTLAQSFMNPEHVVPRLETATLDGLRGDLIAWYQKYRPDVILTQHPVVYQYLEDAGIRIPEDVGFLHLGYNTRFSHLAGVDPNWQQRGISAVERVVNQLNRNEFGVPANPMVTYVKGRWAEGPSLRRKE